ncbi:alpha/beta fold hydrolase [Halarchaeum sp. P4]|uniref:alpha/beta fold hydrolase n=1 Tax=Halarchaeum sp. P4 TaxID=3421639 RepID=UPI003EB6E8D6
MKLGKALAGLAGAGAATVAADGLLATLAGPLPPALPGTQRTVHWRGFDVAYAEAGDPDDPDVLLLHGVHAAASSREFRGVWEALAEDYHVVAPDLPGFGRSERPQVAYTAALYEGFVAHAVKRLDAPTVVASSLAGSYAAIAAEEADVSGLVLVCPTADTTDHREWLREGFRAPVLGQAAFDALVSKPALRYFNRREAYAGPIPDGVVEYQWRSAHQRNARFAPASFVGGFLDPVVDLGAELAERDVPVTLVWGREATTTPLAEGRELAENADARLVVLDDAKLLPHDEHPEAFLEAAAPDLP